MEFDLTQLATQVGPQWATIILLLGLLYKVHFGVQKPLTKGDGNGNLGKEAGALPRVEAKLDGLSKTVGETCERMVRVETRMEDLPCRDGCEWDGRERRRRR